MVKKSFDLSEEEIRVWLTGYNQPAPTAEEVKQAEEALLHFADAYATQPHPSLGSQVLAKIKMLNHHKKNRQTLRIGQLPMLDESSNWLDWQEAVEPIKNPDHYKNVHLHPLESNEKRDLFVVWAKDYVATEVHHEVLESFLILEGTCECHITNKAGNTRTVKMRVGDFITMPLGETHDIWVTSREPTKAILQWLKQVS